MDIGIIANPASGKDIRRLTARASVFDNQEKSAMVRRCLAGIEGICPMARIHYFPDSHHITSAALAGAKLCGFPIAMVPAGTAEDSSIATRRLSHVDVLISLGGDGTNRAIAKELSDIPLIALSTGTNNAFPILCEATSAGIAAAMIASGRVPINSVAPRTKVVLVRYENGERDLALIDVVGTIDRFTGTRAILAPANFVYAVLGVADPCRVGVTAIGGMANEVDDADDVGLALTFPRGEGYPPVYEVRAPIAPGIVEPVALSHIERVPFNKRLHFVGASMLAFDGERERTLNIRESVEVWVERDGPRRVDVKRCLQCAARWNGLSLPSEMRTVDYAN